MPLLSNKAVNSKVLRQVIYAGKSYTFTQIWI